MKLERRRENEVVEKSKKDAVKLLCGKFFLSVKFTGSNAVFTFKYPDKM